MIVRVLGCSGGVSREDHGISLVIDDRVSVDAGSVASRQTLEEQGRIESILVTHAHLDHVGDLGAMCDTRLQQEGRPLEVVGMSEVIEALDTHYFNDVLWPDFAKLPDAEHPILRYSTIEPNQPVGVAGLDALPIPVHHSVPSCGFLLGRAGEPYSLAYSGDTGPTDAFWQEMRKHEQLRVLVTEVSFPDRLQDLADLSGHLTTQGFAAEMEKLDPASDLRIAIYGMKPAFADEIMGEVEDLGLSAELLTEGAVLDLTQTTSASRR